MEFKATDGTVHSSGYVARDGKKHFGALEVYRGPESSPSVSKKRVRWLPTYNTGIPGAFNDKSTGCVMHYSTSMGLHGEEFRFEITHRRKAFDVYFGGGDCGLSSFLGEISGGKVGEEVYKGVEFTDVCVFPRKFDLNTLMDVLTY